MRIAIQVIPFMSSFFFSIKEVRIPFNNFFDLNNFIWLIWNFSHATEKKVPKNLLETAKLKIPQKVPNLAENCHLNFFFR